MADPKRALARLSALSRVGLRIAIDDFGTGYSSLAYLKRLPVDVLKIDRSFVRDLRANPNDRIIVRSTIDLAHNLGLRVVAEGVEDVVAAGMLREFGCDEIQGFLPEPASISGGVRTLARRLVRITRRRGLRPITTPSNGMTAVYLARSRQPGCRVRRV